MQSQMIGMQSSLDRILSAVQPPHGNPGMPPHPALFPPHMEAHRDPSGLPPQPRNGFEGAAGPADRGRSFPPLPGFAPPVSLCIRLVSFVS